jgi:hypothetical protein
MVNVIVEDTVTSGKRTFVIRHNLGRKVSYLISELVAKIFWEIVKIKIDTEMTNTTVIATLRSRLD